MNRRCDRRIIETQLNRIGVYLCRDVAQTDGQDDVRRDVVLAISRDRAFQGGRIIRVKDIQLHEVGISIGTAAQASIRTARERNFGFARPGWHVAGGDVLDPIVIGRNIRRNVRSAVGIGHGEITGGPIKNDIPADLNGGRVVKELQNHKGLFRV